MFFPSPSTCKMAKYAPNNVLMKMICLDQTSHEIIEDGDVPILSVVLINPDSLQLSLHHNCDLTGILLSNLRVEVNTIYIRP